MQQNAKAFSVCLRVSAAKKLVTTQGAMMDGEEETTKYAKGAKRQAATRKRAVRYRECTRIDANKFS